MSLHKFNPYKEAAGDAALVKYTNRHLFRGWCRKCNTEKPMKGGQVSASGRVKSRNGVVQKFVCADCLKLAAENNDANEHQAPPPQMRNMP